MSHSDPIAHKQQLREQARKNRIAQPDKEAVSAMICASAMSHDSYTHAGTVLWYVDAGSEVRTRHTLPQALTHGKRVIVPYCIVETNELALFHLEDMGELVEGAYKILEPKLELRDLPTKQVAANDLDLVYVPGTAFDLRGGRMGQGKGYYDRLLANVRPDTQLIGLAFECQVFPEIPVAPHDVFMNHVVTEKRWISGHMRGT